MYYGKKIYSGDILHINVLHRTRPVIGYISLSFQKHINIHVYKKIIYGNLHVNIFFIFFIT
jgi:hypothetical protein